MEAERNTRRYQIGGMDCASCAAKIDTAVRKLSGIADVNVSATTGSMTVTYGAEGDLDTVERAVTRLGYTITPTGAATRDRDTRACRP